MFEHVIVPLDGTAFSERALAYATTIAEKFDAPLTLIRAYEGPERAVRTLAVMESQPAAGGGVDPATAQAVTEAAAAERVEAATYLEEQARALTARGLSVETFIADNDGADAILDVANRAADPLIVMATHGRGGLNRLVFGS